MNRGLNLNVIKTALDEVVMTEYLFQPGPGVATAQDPVLFNQGSMDSGAHIIEVFEGVGEFTSHVEQQNLDEEQVRVDDQVTYTPVNYKKAVPVPHEYFEDDKWDTVRMMMREVGAKARVTQDNKSFGLFRDGFTTQTTADGEAWFSNSHTNLNGDTIDNLETAALTGVTQLETLQVALLEQKDQAGVIRGSEAACLLVPPALFKEATEAAQSELVDADNQVNYLSLRYPSMQLKQSQYLGAAASGSDTAYFMLGRIHQGYRWVREAFNTDLVDKAISDNDVYKYKARFRETVGAHTYEGAVASNGTA